MVKQIIAYIILVACLACCDDGPEAPTMPLGGPAVPQPQYPSIPRACASGESRVCRVTVKSGNYTSCFDSVQVCKDGHWSECGKKE